jgi:hypothetical protein
VPPSRATGGPHGIGGLSGAILGAGVGTLSVVVPSAVGEGAATARRVLDRMLRRRDGSRDLVVALAEGRLPPLVKRVIEYRLTEADKLALDRLTRRRSAPAPSFRRRPQH